jgi:TolB-like protein/DNA-binding winged helix-turn-helix (wHTH) protein/Tfp pilus assembly protein PilF
MPGQEQPRTIRRFGPFSLDPQTGEVTHDGRRIRLQPQPSRILILLTDSPGRLVTREEIRVHIWGVSTVADVDQSLNFAVRQIRAVLCDGADKPRYVETIAKRGYRFIAPVSEVSTDRESAHSQQASTPTALYTGEVFPLVRPQTTLSNRIFTGGRPRPHTVFFLVLVAVGLLSFVLLYSFRPIFHHPATSAIVVLPFVNLTGDPSLEYLSDGVTDETIARLARIDPAHLQVIARTSAMSYKGTHQTAQQIGNDLRVQYVVEGSVQREDGEIRVIAQLVRVSDQMHLWAQSYEGSQQQLLAFDKEISEAVADSLSIKSHDSRGEYTPVSSEAYNQFLQGMYSLSQRSQAGFEDALLNFGHAVELDPQYARAYAQLAVTYDLMGQYGWMKQVTASSQAEAAALQALALDDSLSEAHAALGFSDWFYNWNPIGAEKEFQRAIALDPNNVDAHHWYSQVLMTDGRTADAERQMNAALVLDPKSLILRTNLGWIHYTARQFPSAIGEMKRAVDQDPKFLAAHYKLWWTYSVVHDEPHAWQEFQIVIHAISSPEQAKTILSAYEGGGYTAALKALSRSGDWNYYGNQIDGARCMMFSGDQKGALARLAGGVESHDGWMIFVPTDPAFESLHANPAYIRLMSQLHETALKAEQQPLHSSNHSIAVNSYRVSSSVRRKLSGTNSLLSSFSLFVR